jgi:hypothetical protein
MFPDIARDDVFRLETRRLWLRWPRVADAKAVERYSSRWEVARMTSRIPHPYPPGEAERSGARRHGALRPVPAARADWALPVARRRPARAARLTPRATP